MSQRAAADPAGRRLSRGVIPGTAFLQEVGIWPNPPTWAPFVLLAVALALALLLAIMPAKRGAHVLLSVEGTTVALILVVTAVVLVRLLAGNAPGGHTFTWSVFSVAPGTGTNDLFLGVVFGFLSFAGFEAAATLGEEANRPRDIPRAILGTAVFGGLYFVIVTAVEVMGFGAGPAGVKAFTSSPSLLGDLGSSYVGNWVGNVITLGTAISAFGCCRARHAAARRARRLRGPAGLAAEMRSPGPRRATYCRIMKLLSVNVGRPRPNPWKQVKLTAIDKRPVEGPVMVTRPGAKGLGMVGLAGDRVYDVRNHGGPDQAGYAYAREDLDFWAAALGRPLSNGMFGENLTTSGLDVSGALIGERWRIGPDVILEASAPRIPCGTFQGWMLQAGWIKRFTQAARPGSYLRVVEPGEIRAGDRIEVVHQPDHDVTVEVAFRALTLAPELLPRLLAADALPRELRELARRRTA
jgi:MOSC domain-containing protein YiiM